MCWSSDRGTHHISVTLRQELQNGQTVSKLRRPPAQHRLQLLRAGVGERLLERHQSGQRERENDKVTNRDNSNLINSLMRS